MKIALAQLNFRVADFEGNSSKIRQTIRRGLSESADLVVFSELSVCGYPPKDMLEQRGFAERCEQVVAEIAKECKRIAAIIGSPSVNKSGNGKPLYNSAFFLEEGKIKKVFHKSLLPTYDVFDEYRYFEPASEVNIFEFKGKKIALTICEDIWSMDPHPLYRSCPMDTLIKEKPELMINISASPFSWNHAEERLEMYRKNVLKYKIPLVAVNQIGAQSDLIFDGGSLVISEKGQVTNELNYFNEDFCIADSLSLNKKPETWNPKPETVSKYFRIYNALLLGIRDYFGKSNLQKAIVGLSGGIDSAVVLTLAAEALGKENVLALLMPSEFSSAHSLSDAKALTDRLGVKHEIIPIQKIFTQYREELKPLFGESPFDLAEENIQSRIRGALLMAAANKFGYTLLNTSNKSELATGYGTLYGDMTGGLSVIGDLYKTDVYGLAAHLNRESEIIPDTIIRKVPSAELRPDQKDSDTLPEYEQLDKVLFRYIEENKNNSEIVMEGFDEKLVTRILKMVNANEYKRHQFCPILRVSSKAFGTGRRMPLVAKY